MTLPAFTPGQCVVAEERWRGLLWSAVPQRVVTSGPDLLLTYVPAGAVSVIATNRGSPETIGLTRSERKLLALKTCAARASEFFESPSRLAFTRPGRWSRITVGWDPNGGFLGWYVNFESPPMPTTAGVASKDLVLDLWVDADLSWRWKDREDFDTAIEEGVLDPALRDVLLQEADRVLAEISDRSGPFAPQWPEFRAGPDWPVPILPEPYGWGGDQWDLPAGDRSPPSSG